MALDPNIGWLPKSKAMKMIREHFSNLKDFTDNEVIQILAKIGIEMDFDLSLGLGETPQFRFVSLRERVRKRLTAAGRSSPDSIDETIKKSGEWTDLLKDYPPKSTPS